MIRISFRSFFLGLGFGIIIVSGINLLNLDMMNNNSKLSSSTVNNNEIFEKEEDDYIILLINSNTSKKEVFEHLIKNGFNFDFDKAMQLCSNKTLKNGLYKISKEEDIKKIVNKITLQKQQE